MPADVGVLENTQGQTDPHDHQGNKSKRDHGHISAPLPRNVDIIGISRRPLEHIGGVLLGKAKNIALRTLEKSAESCPCPML